MAIHLESWYAFANIKMGYEVGNGDLRLVIGCHKAPSWGMAAFSNGSQTSNLRLQFRLLDQPGRQSTGPAHEWEYASGHGMTEVRVGPSNDNIRANDRQPLCNQALFLLTLNGVLSEEQWTRVHRPAGQFLASQTQDRDGYRNNATAASSSSMVTDNAQASSSAAKSEVGRNIAGSGATKSGEADLREIYHQADIRLALENHKVCGLRIQRLHLSKYR